MSFIIHYPDVRLPCLPFHRSFQKLPSSHAVCLRTFESRWKAKPLFNQPPRAVSMKRVWFLSFLVLQAEFPKTCASWLFIDIRSVCHPLESARVYVYVCRTALYIELDFTDYSRNDISGNDRATKLATPREATTTRPVVPLFAHVPSSSAS